mgnify:CR=1 FL=1
MRREGRKNTNTQLRNASMGAFPHLQQLLAQWIVQLLLPVLKPERFGRGEEMGEVQRFWLAS